MSGQVYDENIAQDALQRGHSNNMMTVNNNNVDNKRSLTTRHTRNALSNINNNTLNQNNNNSNSNNQSNDVAKAKSYNNNHMNISSSNTNSNYSTQPSSSSMMSLSSSSQSSAAAAAAAISAAANDADSVALVMHDVTAAIDDDRMGGAEYMTDVMTHMRSIESLRHPSPRYMAKQTDINAKMREILVDWLVEVHLKFKLRPETLFLTVNVIDRFLERRAVSRTKLQLVGCTAMLIASKYEEIYAPEVNDFVYISDRAYTREQILAMESIVLNTLKFNLTTPSSHRFNERYIKVAQHTITQSHGVHDATYASLVHYLTELTLQNYAMLRHRPSLLAASACSLALRILHLPAWNANLQHHTGYSHDDLAHTVRDVHAILVNGNPKYRAVRKKFGSKKRFCGVADIPVPTMNL